MQYQPYERTTNYYETDQMGIIHHSNYIRYMEEARTDYLNQMGLPYKSIEEQGILIPVLSVSCDYRSSIRYGDTVSISVCTTRFNGIKLDLAYEIRDKKSNELRAKGTTSHCFLDKSFHPIQLKKTHPSLYEDLMKSLPQPDSDPTP